MSQPVILDGAALKRRIVLLGVTQMEFAQAHGLDYSYISKLITGKRGVRGPYLHRLAAALGCEPADILADEATSAAVEGR